MTFDFIPYMRNIAVSLKELSHTDTDKHFQRVTSLAALEEFLANSRSINGFQLVAVDKISGRLNDDSHSDNLMDRRMFSFYLFKNVRHGHFDEHENAIKECKAVVNKIESRMFYDKNTAANGLQNLNRSFYYDSIGPFAQGWYGLMVTFTVADAAGITYNPNDWQ